MASGRSMPIRISAAIVAARIRQPRRSLMWHKVEAYVNRAIARIRLPFRGVIGQVSSAADVQLVSGTGLSGEVVQDAEYFQHYGFTSNPPDGAMMIVAPVGG